MLTLFSCPLGYLLKDATKVTQYLRHPFCDKSTPAKHFGNFIFDKCRVFISGRKVRSKYEFTLVEMSNVTETCCSETH